MSISWPRRYKLFTPSVWNENEDDYVCDIEMSSMPSKQDILDALKKANQIDNRFYYDTNYTDKIKIDRPDGWHYKKILVFEILSNTEELIWKIFPLEEEKK